MSTVFSAALLLSLCGIVVREAYLCLVVKAEVSTILRKSLATFSLRVLGPFFIAETMSHTLMAPTPSRFPVLPEVYCLQNLLNCYSDSEC